MGILFFCMGEGCVSMWAVWILSGEVTKTNVQILLLTHALVDHYPPPPPSTTLPFLRSDLGTGKTCFARGFIRARVGIPCLAVTSPSYLLDNTYKVEDEDVT